jgi:hypothetical protein
MKKLLLNACVALISPVYAQYFEHHYGTPNLDNAQWGMYTYNAPPVTPPAGFVISGISQMATAQLNRLMVSRTDNNGNVPLATHFNNIYTLFSPTGAVRSVNDAKVIELPGAVGFAVAGTCTENSTGMQYVYYLQLNANGTPVNPVNYYRTNDQQYRLNGIRLAPNGAFVYLVGETVTANVQRFFVMKLTLGGAAGWPPFFGFTYAPTNGVSQERGFDVLEDPIAGVVAVVGTSTTAGNTDAFFYRLIPANGNPINPMNLYGTNGSYDHFYSLDNSTDPAVGGYVIGGYSNAGSSAGLNDAWVIRLNAALAVNWSDLIDYNCWGVNNECRDVVESFNPAVGYEYYAGGNTVAGLQGGPDMELDKLTAGGFMMWQGTYGNQGNQFLAAIDENPVNNDISLYGTTQPGMIGGSDMCIFNVNLNGKTACDYQIGYCPERPGPKLNGQKDFAIRDRFSRTTGIAEFSTYQDIQVCWVQALPVIAPKSGDAPSMQLDIYGTGEHSVTLEISGAESAPAELMVTDISGRVLYTGKVLLQEGTMLLPVDLTGQVSNGIYLVTLRQGAVTTTRKVLIAK